MTKLQNGTKADQADRCDQNNNQNNVSKRRSWYSPKEFKIQESYICRTLSSKDMKSTFHIILAFLVYFFIANTLYYYSNPHEMTNEMNFVISLFDHIEVFIGLHVAFTVLILAVIYPLTKLWIQLRTKSKPNHFVYDIVYASIISAIYGIMIYIKFRCIISLDIGIVMTVAICTEQARFLMKSNAFIIEAYRKQEIALRKDKKDAKFTTYGQLIFFLYAPTLVYRDEYPRLEKRDYKLLVKLCTQYAIVLYLMMAINVRILMPFYSKIGKGPIDGYRFLKELTGVFLASSACCLLTFYGFLHLYNNICSQILRFGDRVFYEDWWTCTDYSTYYRKWNILVHDWNHAYLYTPFVYMFKGNKVMAGLLSIYISALAHEYIIAMAIRHVNPILSILFGGFGASFFVINGLLNIAYSRRAKNKLKESKSDADLRELRKRKKETDFKSVDFTINNTLFLLGTFNGWFVMITIYGIGYYARINCLGEDAIFTTFSSDCLKIKF